MVKIHRSVAMANETFDEAMLALHGGDEDPILPLYHEIMELKSKGVEMKRIEEVLSRARKELIALGKEV